VISGAMPDVSQGAADLMFAAPPCAPPIFLLHAFWQELSYALGERDTVRRGGATTVPAPVRGLRTSTRLWPPLALPHNSTPLGHSWKHGAESVHDASCRDGVPHLALCVGMLCPHPPSPTTPSLGQVATKIRNLMAKLERMTAQLKEDLDMADDMCVWSPLYTGPASLCMAVHAVACSRKHYSRPPLNVLFVV
jgi:hypothetical protein